MALTKRKLLSQNFLGDPELVKKLVTNSGINEGDTVLEIGPGSGIITGELLKVAGKIIAIELDSPLYNELRQKFENKNNIELFNADFLSSPLPRVPYKVFSNIPFRFTGEIIKKLLRDSNPPTDAFLIVQKEAAEKFLGNSLLSTIFYPSFEFSIQYNFKRTDFSPVPEVDIVFLQVHRRDYPIMDVTDRKIFEDFVAYTYSGKKPYVTHLSKNPTQLTADEWVNLFRNFKIHGNDIKIRRITGSSDKLFSEQEKLQKIHRTRNDNNWKSFRPR